MKIMVIGSNGTLGKPLVKELRGREHDVFCVDKDHNADPQSMRVDVSNFRQLMLALKQFKPQYVYLLGAEFGRLNGDNYYEQLWKTNAIGTRNVLELQQDLGFKLIFASSSEIYGDNPHDILTEDLPLRESIWPKNDYAISKLVNEMQIVNATAKYGTDTMRLRFFNAYGPGEYYHSYRSVVCLFCYRLLHGIPIDIYKNYHRVFMYVDDFIPTLANACATFISGQVFNIGGSEYRSVEELANIVADKLTMTKVTRDRLFHFQDVDTHNVVNKRPDITKALTVLGHNPKTTLEEGIPKTIEWMQEVYKL